MTRKDYERFARFFRDQREDLGPLTFDKLVSRFMNELQNDNARFDRERFRRAVYHGEEGTI